MRYMPTLAFQTVCFMYSAGLGFSLAIVYDLFRILFYMLTGSDKKYSWVRDIIFTAVCLIANFIFLLVVCDGRMYVYSFLSEAGGAFVWFYSVSSFLFFPAKRAIKKVKRYFSHIKDFFIRIKTRIYAFFEKIFKKLHKTVKKYLHIRHNIVYNFFVNLCSGVFIKKKRGDSDDRTQFGEGEKAET